MIDYFNMILSYRYDVERMIVDAVAVAHTGKFYLATLAPCHATCPVLCALRNLEGQHR